MCQKVIRGVVEDAAYRRVRSAHDSLHSVNGAEIVAAVNAVRAPCSHQDVLIVVRHTDDFVRHDLSNRQDEIEISVADQLIYFHWPAIVELDLGLFSHEITGNFPYAADIPPPV